MADLPGPQTPQPPSGRTRHPYFMHDMIRRQTVAAQATHRATTERLASEPLAPPKSTLLWVGEGSSYHAALAAGDAARRRGARYADVQALASFDVVEAPAPVPADTTAVVFSASGETALTLQAAERLRAEGARVLLITSQPTSRAHTLADLTLDTRYAEEASWAHTVSFTAGLVAADALLDHWAGVPTVDGDEERVGEAVTAALATENAMVDLVDVHAGCDRYLLIGSGACAPAAREAALKLREAAGRFAAAVGVEELLHGVLPSVHERSVVVAHTTTALERARALQGLDAARHLGARTLLVDSSGGPAGEGIIALPATQRPMPTVLHVIPLQFLAYWTGVAEGRNPDVIGLDDPRQLAARSMFGT